MYNNEDYDGPIFKNKEENVKNFFSQEQFASPILSKDEYNFSFNNNVQNMDMPPELDPIKNLSDATKIDGPTLSVLDPIKSIPENFDDNTNNMSKLDLYDNGINVNNNSYNENSYYETNYNQENENNTNDINLSNTSNSYDYDVNNKSNIQNNDYNSDTNMNNNIDDFLNNKNDSNDISKDNYNLGLDSLPDLRSYLNFKNDEKQILEENQIDENEYNIVQNVSLEPKTIPTIENIEDINNIYNEPDTLEIMDFETDNQNNKKELIDKIKNYISELKNSGEQIELEEFDFENTYQLIIKVNKEGDK